MTTADRLYYSRDHWDKQFNDRLANSVVYERRVARGEICTPERAAEVMGSQRDRIFYAHVNRFAMRRDPLRLDGISFGVMLDDAKKKLRAEIDRRAQEETALAAIFDKIDDEFFEAKIAREGGRRFGKTGSLQRDKLFVNEAATMFYPVVGSPLKFPDNGYK